MERDPLFAPFSAAALRERRQRAGLTRPALSRKIKSQGGQLSPQQINRIESGASTPMSATVLALAEALACRFDDLLITDTPQRETA